MIRWLWIKSLGLEKSKRGTVVTVTVPAERVEGWAKRLWRRLRGY